ncbi:MAG: acyl-CoA thioesterase [Bacteroidales bacterium]|nr:acyl-CoA thioesterase [Bacteroidales bacterium]MBN2749512.1 acyl-CoA thioesterase [Bacteroidales bacterium]
MKNLSLHNPLHKTPIQIRFSDLDKLNHVSNSVYQQYYDLGRIAYFDDVFKERISWDPEGLIVVSIKLDFYKAITLYDKMAVRTKIVKIGNKSLTMYQDLYNEDTGEVTSASESVMAAVDYHKGESIPMPQRWRERIGAFEQGV